jgi:hypothetical protein
MREIEGTYVDVSQFEQQPPSSHIEYTRKQERLVAWAKHEAKYKHEHGENWLADISLDEDTWS